MILKKIKRIIKRVINENREFHKTNLLQLKELEWAHIYHDSIRGKKGLENLPLNIGRWAGNYSFFYVLNRILSDYKPKNILEFGLGESSKFVSTFLENELLQTNHHIIEQDEQWYQSFKNNYQLSSRSKVTICPLIKKTVLSYEVNSYNGLKEVIQQKYDLYIVDGPFGSKHYSRYDIVAIANSFDENDEFIILIDDYNRKGERETTSELIKVLKSKNINLHVATYEGNKQIALLATEKYKYVTSL